MKTRCFKNNASNYKFYGGKGISVCDEWKNDFFTFYKWCIENGYRFGKELDRKDPNKDYHPNNCRFVDHRQNTHNSIFKNKSSKYKGVALDRGRGKFLSSIMVHGKTKNLGRFNNEENAALCYDSVSKYYYGQHAFLNLPDMATEPMHENDAKKYYKQIDKDDQNG
jgi:hypothetical protein